MTEMIPTLLNKKWTLLLPEHRANRGVYPEGTPHPGEPVWDHWESERLASMHDLLKPGDLAIDVGAEEGDLSALYASWGCRVFLAEPNPKAWPDIRVIFEGNGLTDRVAGWLVGFFGERIDGSTYDSFMLGGVADGPFRQWPEVTDGEVTGETGFKNLCENDNPELPVPELTIDSVFATVEAEFAPAAITIDVEGSELRVLRGAVETIRRHRPLLFVSVHPEFMRDQYGDDPQDLEDFLDDEGYDAELLADVHEQHWLYRPRY